MASGAGRPPKHTVLFRHGACNLNMKGACGPTAGRLLACPDTVVCLPCCLVCSSYSPTTLGRRRQNPQRQYFATLITPPPGQDDCHSSPGASHVPTHQRERGCVTKSHALAHSRRRSQERAGRKPSRDLLLSRHRCPPVIARLRFTAETAAPISSLGTAPNKTLAPRSSTRRSAASAVETPSRRTTSRIQCCGCWCRLLRGT
jgi:hypothetical protein